MQTRIITLIAWACLSSASLFGCSGGDDSSPAGTGGTTGTGGGGNTGTGGGNNGTGGLQSTGCYTGFDYSSYTPGATARTLTADVQPIFAVSCALSSACHLTPAAQRPYLGPAGAANATQNMNILTELVAKKAVEAPTINYVTSGDPANSWLMMKIDQGGSTITCSGLCPSNAVAAGCGTPMPQGFPQLDSTKRGIIRDWIKGGATL